MIAVEDLSLAYKDPGSGPPNQIINNLNLSVQPGESISIIGPSGCGKSSLLFILAGLIKPTSGNVSVLNQPVQGPSEDVALILQESGLLPWKTVWGNGTLGPTSDPALRDSRLQSALKELGLKGMEKRFPAQLSGGERRRVALARALAQDAKIILMDEPLAALDALTKESTQNLILGLWKHYQFTLVLVTHDIEEAVFLGQKILIFAPRPTKVLKIVDNPEMGEVGYREESLFFDRVKEIRSILVK